mmetsp:Transcript_8272/g.18084  ORF Transcript_8272/g.18084 Transcript_8272/m.18084 type:complete len:308 (+) Transcript_8272:79-1002(+)|eukprot:6198315-Pleurochrysis_carterae.AAC.2
MLGGMRALRSLFSSPAPRGTLMKAASSFSHGRQPCRFGATYYKRGVAELNMHDISPETPEGQAKLNEFSEAALKIIATKVKGMDRAAFLNTLLADYNIRLPRNAAASRKMIRTIPEVACLRKAFNPGGARDVVLPAYTRRMFNAWRDISHYDESTEAGAATLQQFRDTVNTLLDYNPKGLQVVSFLKLAKPYGHLMDHALAKKLLQSMPDLVKYEESPTYEEYDAIRPLAESELEKLRGTLSGRQFKVEFNRRIHERFLRWYTDPFTPRPRRKSGTEVDAELADAAKDETASADGARSQAASSQGAV